MTIHKPDMSGGHIGQIPGKEPPRYPRGVLWEKWYTRNTSSDETLPIINKPKHPKKKGEYNE
jgi:hypothetical protein